jgi:hypothetical protein
LVVVTLPEVGVSSFIKESKPIKIVETDQLGFQSSGWKSLILKHNLVLSWNLPLGVYIITEGGLKGYSWGNKRTPVEGEEEGDREIREMEYHDTNPLHMEFLWLLRSHNAILINYSRVGKL